MFWRSHLSGMHGTFHLHDPAGLDLPLLVKVAFVRHLAIREEIQRHVGTSYNLAYRQSLVS